jgi:hypothetical protein
VASHHPCIHGSFPCRAQVHMHQQLGLKQKRMENIVKTNQRLQQLCMMPPTYSQMQHVWGMSSHGIRCGMACHCSLRLKPDSHATSWRSRSMQSLGSTALIKVAVYAILAQFVGGCSGC